MGGWKPRPALGTASAQKMADEITQLFSTISRLWFPRNVIFKQSFLSNFSNTFQMKALSMETTYISILFNIESLVLLLGVHLIKF